MTHSSGHNVILSPICALDASLLGEIGKEIYRIFLLDAEVVPLLNDVGFALDTERKQYHSTAVLDRLAAVVPEEALKAIALVDVDLFIPILTHVYGEAQLGGKTAIVSTYRLRDDAAGPNEKQFRQRMTKEVIHELGHTFNLRHCREHTCIMHYCRTIEDVDKKNHELCRYCRVLFEDEIKKLAGNKPPAE